MALVICHVIQSSAAAAQKMEGAPARVVRGGKAADRRREGLIGQQEREPVLPARRQRPQVRGHRGAVHQETQPDDEAGEHDDRDRRAVRVELHDENLRGPGKDDRAHAERSEKADAGRGRADAADQAERDQPEARGQHFRETLAKIPGGN